MAKIVSKTYGMALFAVAFEEKRVDEFFEAARLVSCVLGQNDDFCKWIKHPKITREDKIRIVEKTFLENIPKEVVGVMVLLIAKRHAKDIFSVFDYFIDLVKKEKKIGKAEVVTAVPMSDRQKAKVEAKLLETTEYESFEMNYLVDTSIIGGMIIRIGDRVVDSSVKTKLINLTREMRKTRLKM